MRNANLKHLLITSAVPLVAFIVLLTALWVSKRAVQTPTSIPTQAQTESVSFSFNPSSASLPPDSTISLWLDPQAHPLSFVRIDLMFEPSLIQLTQNPIVSTALANTISLTTASQANTTGVITIALGLAPEDRDYAPDSTFEFARFRFTRNPSGSASSASLTFGPTNQIVDLNLSELAFSPPAATFAFTNPSATPTPANVGGDPLPTSTPTSPAAGGSTGVPNSCGGTCGSNSNCQSAFTCYTGFCRNPSCPSSSNCVCPTPTIPKSPTSTKPPTLPNPTEYIVENVIYPTDVIFPTTYPSPTHYPQPTTIPTPTQPPSLIAKAGLPSLIGLGGLICLWLLSRIWFKHRQSPPPPPISPPPPMPPHP